MPTAVKPMHPAWEQVTVRQAPISAELEEALNPTKVPSFEAVAPKGVGVFDTLKAVSKLVLKALA